MLHLNLCFPGVTSLLMGELNFRNFIPIAKLTKI